MRVIPHGPPREASVWHKSSHSNREGGDCLEVAAGNRASVPIRDSKRPHGPVLLVRNAAWTAFLGAVRTGAPLSS
ncbi:DUF397 domain-containing protein [Streptomyces sp. NPDC058171]